MFGADTHISYLVHGPAHFLTEACSLQLHLREASARKHQQHSAIQAALVSPSFAESGSAARTYSQRLLCTHGASLYSDRHCLLY